MYLPRWVKIVRVLGFILGLCSLVFFVVVIGIGLANGEGFRSRIGPKSLHISIMETLLMLPWRYIRSSILYAFLATVYFVLLTRALIPITNEIRDVLISRQPFSNASSFEFLLLLIVAGIVLIAQVPALWVIRRHITAMRHDEQHPTDVLAK